jgi:hypothetical protein
MKMKQIKKTVLVVMLGVTLFTGSGLMSHHNYVATRCSKHLLNYGGC